MSIPIKMRCEQCLELLHLCYCDGFLVCLASGCSARLHLEFYDPEPYLSYDTLMYKHKKPWFCDEHFTEEMTKINAGDSLAKRIRTHPDIWYAYTEWRKLQSKPSHMEECLQWNKICDDFKRPYCKWVLPEKNKRVAVPHSYLLTFTWNNVVPKDKWLEAVKKQLSRKNFKLISATVEHPDSNIHVHAYTVLPKMANAGGKNDTFHSFKKNYGHVDVKLVEEDNGVTDYFENPVTNINDLKI